MVEVEQFYNSFKDEYTQSVQRSNPCYNEMLEALLGYLPAAWTPGTILELGCGTGNLTLLLRERFPQATLIGVDAAEGCLNVCRKRLGDAWGELRQVDMRKMQFAPQSFDLVTSSLTLHHLTDTEKKALYGSVHGWLKHAGLFVFCDRFKDESDQVTHINRQIWKESAFARGTTEQEWERWMKHEAEHDHPGSLIQQIAYLQEAKFKVSEIVWRKYLWATVYSQKERATA